MIRREQIHTKDADEKRVGILLEILVVLWKNAEKKLVLLFRLRLQHVSAIV